jgi:hypothetical protein
MSIIEIIKKRKNIDEITTKYEEPETHNGTNYIKIGTVCYGLFMCVFGTCICTMEPFKACKY